ncbi:MAG: hypothetical protein JXO72_03925 [Vicinamibacteria bacterium]|nr:hypothetical protein [Vicinamibacteria bacterium]
MHDARRQEKQIEEIAAKCRSESARLTRLRLAFEESATLGPRTLGTINDLNEMVTDVENARQDLMQALMRLQRDGETAMDREARLVARRVLRGFISETYYSGQQYRRNGQFDKARVASELHEIMRPKSPLPAYEMARTAAARGDKKNALAELRRSIELGFSDLWRLADDEEWKDLADQPEIKAIIEELHSRRVR